MSSILFSNSDSLPCDNLRIVNFCERHFYNRLKFLLLSFSLLSSFYWNNTSTGRASVRRGSPAVRKFIHLLGPGWSVTVYLSMLLLSLYLCSKNCGYINVNSDVQWKKMSHLIWFINHTASLFIFNSNNNNINNNNSM